MVTDRVRILSISDDDGLRLSRQLLLVNEGYDVVSLNSNDALSVSAATPCDIALICQSVHPQRAAALPRMLRSQHPEILIVWTAGIENRTGLSEGDLQVSSGPERLLEAIRGLCNQRAAARKGWYEVSHLG
jgi:hypothetical protein